MTVAAGLGFTACNSSTTDDATKAAADSVENKAQQQASDMKENAVATSDSLKAAANTMEDSTKAAAKAVEKAGEKKAEAMKDEKKAESKK